jgi:hypothetical protein
MPAFIGKNPRAWRENIAGDGGGIKLAGDGGGKDGGKEWREGWRERVAGRVEVRAEGKHGGVNGKRRETIHLTKNRVHLTRITRIGFNSPDILNSG